jgi:ribose/xylose/arabinose/galactoside ABC-type transport system permease subunit
MRTATILMIVGATLGATVAILAHFLSHTLPSTYYVGGVTVEGSNRVDQTLQSPLVHPSWLPLLPAAIVIGAAVGAVVGALAHAAGVRVTRRRPA